MGPGPVWLEVCTGSTGTTLGLDVVAGYDAQEHEGLDPHRNLVDQLRDAATGQSESELRALRGIGRRALLGT